MNFRRLSIKTKTEYNENSSSSENNLSENNNIQYENLENNINQSNIKHETFMKTIIINTRNYQFEITINKDIYGDEYFTIYNKDKKYCIRMKKDFDIENKIYLQYLNFFETCSKNKSLLKKSGTLEMLLSVLQYTRDYYKENLKYIFEDDSVIIIESITLKLNIIYILLYGETWYMKYVNAIPCSNEFINNLSKINEYLDTKKDSIIKYFTKISDSNNININNNSLIDFMIPNEIFDKIKLKINNNNLTKLKLMNEIKKIYISSNTSRIFFQKLYKKYGMIIFLLIDYFGYYKYISSLLDSRLYFDSDMRIPNDYINSIDIIINNI
jgi:hypothetical protein